MDIDINFEGNKRISASFKDQVVYTDQPVSDGGDGSAASPFDLFLVSMGTCVGYYVKAFCDNRKISTEGIKIIQTSEYSDSTKLVDSVKINIIVPESFPENYKDGLLAVAGKCKVKKHLENPPKIVVRIK